MLNSEYSYSGDQNKASNGQTSTQIPQYIHGDSQFKTYGKQLGVVVFRPVLKGGGISYDGVF